MGRTYTSSGERQEKRIDKEAVADFFNQRAEKIPTLGDVQAVIYQDKQPDLAIRRDLAEKSKLLPLLQLNGEQRVLDVGCGTGRWAGDLLPLSSWYHGIDACEGLVRHAQEKFYSFHHARFTTIEANLLSLEALNEAQPFDRILCAGVLIYLNDDEVQNVLQSMATALAPGGLILLREPFGIEKRLTVHEHYSSDMEQTYNAIYRTRTEVECFLHHAMPEPEFYVIGFGDVYEETTLNNRSDTKQQWLLMGRR